MKVLSILSIFYIIPSTLQQDDYLGDDYLGGKTEVEDNYVFIPDSNNDNIRNNNKIIEGSGNNEAIDNDDEDYTDYSKTANHAETGSGRSDDETIYDAIDTLNTLKPELANKVTQKDKTQFSEPGEDEEPSFEIEKYDPNSSDDDTDNNDKIFKPSITESPENNEKPVKSNTDEDTVNKSSSSFIPLPAWIDDFWGERWFVAALLGGAIVGFLIIVIVIIFICHAVRKKDEGSYIIEKDYKQGVDANGAGLNSKNTGNNVSNTEYFA